MGPPGESSGDGTPSVVSGSRRVTGYLTSLGLSLLFCKLGVKVRETQCPSLADTCLCLASLSG